MLKIRFDIDMTEIYKTFTEIGMEESWQPIVVDDYPDIVPEIYRDSPVLLLSDECTGNGMLMIKYSEDWEYTTKSTLVDCLVGRIRIGVVVVDNFLMFESKDLLIKLDMLKLSIPAKKLQKVYKHAITIATELNIKCPMIWITKDCIAKESVAVNCSFKECELILISCTGLNYMIGYLAHELRHSYQNKHAERFNAPYIDLCVNYFGYINQEFEKDAEAYAVSYLNRCGTDGLLICFKAAYENPRGYIRDYINDVDNRSKEISNIYKKY